MSTFFMFGKYSLAAMKGISSKRTQKAINIIRKLGGRINSMYALLGQHDLVIIANLPGVKAIQTGLNLGKRGIKLDEDVIREEIKDYSESLLKSIKKSFKDAGIEKGDISKYMDEIGIRINAGEPIDEIMDSIRQSGYLDLSDKLEKQKVLQVLESFKGEKSPISKAIQRLEKRRAKQIAKMEREGAQLKTSTEFSEDIDDVLALPETEGTVRGFEDNILSTVNKLPLHRQS